MATTIYAWVGEIGRFPTRSRWPPIASGFGGLTYMLTCLGLIFAVIALEAWPVSRLFWSRFAAQPIGTGETAAIAISFSAVAVLTTATWAIARRSALKRLARLRV